MKTYSDYQGEYRTCEYCIFSDWDEGDSDTGLGGYILCEKDDEGILDLSQDSLELAKVCPFWKNDEIKNGNFFKTFSILDVERKISDIKSNTTRLDKILNDPYNN